MLHASSIFVAPIYQLVIS